MSRTEYLHDLKEQLQDLVAQLSDEIAEQELSKNESDHWNDIEHVLNEQCQELDYLFASMEAADERTFYDEDGNEEDDLQDKDGSIW